MWVICVIIPLYANTPVLATSTNLLWIQYKVYHTFSSIQINTLTQRWNLSMSLWTNMNFAIMHNMLNLQNLLLKPLITRGRTNTKITNPIMIKNKLYVRIGFREIRSENCSDSLPPSDYYKPTENRIICNFEFRQITQNSNETYNAFCSRVEDAGRTRYFCDCIDNNSTATEFAIRGQIVIGTSSENIRGKSMLNDWNLADLQKKAMKHKSAAAGEGKISHQVSGWSLLIP